MRPSARRLGRIVKQDECTKGDMSAISGDIFYTDSRPQPSSTDDAAKTSCFFRETRTGTVLSDSSLKLVFLKTVPNGVWLDNALFSRSSTMKDDASVDGNQSFGTKVIWRKGH